MTHCWHTQWLATEIKCILHLNASIICVHFTVWDTISWALIGKGPGYCHISSVLLVTFIFLIILLLDIKNKCSFYIDEPAYLMHLFYYCMAQMEYKTLCKMDFNIIIHCKNVMYCEHEKHDIDFHKHKWQITKFSQSFYRVLIRI